MSEPQFTVSILNHYKLVCGTRLLFSFVVLVSLQINVAYDSFMEEKTT